MVLQAGHRGGRAKSTTGRKTLAITRLLSLLAAGGTSVVVSLPAIFDRNARRIRRDATASDAEPFFVTLMIDELLDRLDTISRPLADALVIGAEARMIAALATRGMRVDVLDPAPRRAARFGGICADEDTGLLPVAAYDLVIALGTLDTVDDLPGSFVLVRRALRPDGVLLACFPGAGSLRTLRAAVAQADARDGRAVARFHPQIDVRAAGDLLVRAGFALPVADVAHFDFAYTSLKRLLDDLRAAAMRNVLVTRHAVGKAWRRALADAFAAASAEGERTREALALIVLTAWAPAPDQPRPAERGSAAVPLARVLEQRGKQRN